MSSNKERRQIIDKCESATQEIMLYMAKLRKAGIAYHQIPGRITYPSGTKCTVKFKDFSSNFYDRLDIDIQRITAKPHQKKCLLVPGEPCRRCCPSWSVWIVMQHPKPSEIDSDGSLLKYELWAAETSSGRYLLSEFLEVLQSIEWELYKYCHGVLPVVGVDAGFDTRITSGIELDVLLDTPWGWC
jgi:hypothetical protein